MDLSPAAAERSLLDLCLGSAFGVRQRPWQACDPLLSGNAYCAGGKPDRVEWCQAVHSPHSHRGGQRFKSPQLHPNQQVSGSFFVHEETPQDHLSPRCHWNEA